jgi:hypothetical protein
MQQAEEAANKLQAAGVAAGSVWSVAQLLSIST